MKRKRKPSQELIMRAVRNGLPLNASISYSLQMRKCGNLKCRCARGVLHGPFWYAYWMEGQKKKSKYIGKPGIKR